MQIINYIPELNKETLVSEKLQLIIILIFLALIFVDKIYYFEYYLFV